MIKSFASGRAGMVLSGALILSGLALTNPTAANAADYYFSRPTNCNWADYGLVLHYNSLNSAKQPQGAEATICSDMPDYNNEIVFTGEQTWDHYKYVYDIAPWDPYLSQPGMGQAVKNNAASAALDDSAHHYVIYYNSNYQGASQAIHWYQATAGGVNGAVNLDSTLKNNDASQRWLAGR